MSSGFSFRAKCTRWLMAAVIAAWALVGGPIVPLMAAHECRDMMMSGGMSTHHAAMPHHDKNSSPNHDCCKRKKAKPAKASMPCCPEQPGSMPRSCGTAEMVCCTLPGREETRRTAKVEKSRGSDAPEVALTKAGGASDRESSRLRDDNLRSGLRYERAVFDLKTDMRT